MDEVHSPNGDFSGLEASRRDLSNAASSVSLRPSVFEIAGGGVGSDPPPQAVVGTETAQAVTG